MTAVVALRHARGVTIGSDSCVSDDDTGLEWYEDEPKYFRASDAVVGYAGPCRACHAAELLPTLRAPRRAERPILYVAHVIAEGIRQAHRAADVPGKGFAALIVWRGRLYEMDDEYGVTEPTDVVAAIGGGGVIALGALTSSLRVAPALAPRDHVDNALAIASARCAGVGGKRHVLDVTTKRAK